MLEALLRSAGVEPQTMRAGAEHVGAELRRVRRALEVAHGVLPDELEPRGTGRLPLLRTVSAPTETDFGVVGVGVLSGTQYVVDYDPSRITRIDVQAELGSPSVAGHVQNADTVGGSALVRWQGLGDDWTGWYVLARGLRVDWSWAVTRLEVAPASASGILCQVLAR